jgi:hypothetical protein
MARPFCTDTGCRKSVSQQNFDEKSEVDPNEAISSTDETISSTVGQFPD